MNRSPSEETVLVAMNYLQDDLLKSISQNLGYHFKETIKQCDRPKDIAVSCKLFFGIRVI